MTAITRRQPVEDLGGHLYRTCEQLHQEQECHELARRQAAAHAEERSHHNHDGQHQVGDQHA
jgi:hypothetical protein